MRKIICDAPLAKHEETRNKLSEDSEFDGTISFCDGFEKMASSKESSPQARAATAGLGRDRPAVVGVIVEMGG